MAPEALDSFSSLVPNQLAPRTGSVYKTFLTSLEMINRHATRTNLLFSGAARVYLLLAAKFSPSAYPARRRAGRG